MSTHGGTLIEEKLIRDALLLPLDQENTEISHLGDVTHVRLTLRERVEEEDVDGVLDSCGFGLIFALGVMSFHDARPRGNSDIDFEDDDQWTVGDMLQHLRHERGALRFYADYVRGRMMKTTVEIWPDGKVILDTVGRGEVATRWLAKLQGKKLMEVVPSAPS